MSGTGHGKLILCGEHAVVYGHPAVAFAVEQHTTVGLTRTDATTATEVVGPDVDDRVTEALCAVLEPTGWRVEVTSDVPVGRGMGSSAALAVALVRARAAADGHDPDALDPDTVFERAMPIERVFHGNPSGLDVAVSARGGCIRYEKGPPPRLAPVTPGDWRVVVLDTGTTGNTAELVAAVGARRPNIDPVLDRIGALVDEAIAAIDDPHRLGALLTENHHLLAQIGVSTTQLDELVSLALQAGAYGAKLAGAGGGGVVIALVDDPERLLAAARGLGIPALATSPWSPS